MPASSTSLEYKPERLLFALLIAVFSVAMTIKYYPGLENEQNYSGNVYQTLNPKAFEGDPYRAPDHGASTNPLKLSLFYSFVSLVGDVALDDRFLALIYIGLIALSLVGIDKTVRVLGVEDRWGRILILLLFLRDHELLDHKLLIAHHQGVNHTAFAIPIIIWLFYVTIARKGFLVILGLSVILTATSIRNATFPIGMAMITTIYIGKPWDRKASLAFIFGGIAASYFVLFHIAAVPEQWRIDLWNILKLASEGDANPFHDDNNNLPSFIIRNALWIGICSSAMILSPRDISAFRGIRIIMVLSLITWLAGGLYISYAPDLIKIPLLLGTVPNRALAWPQNLAYIALAALLLNWARRDPDLGKALAAYITLAAMFIVGPGNIDKWTALVVLATIAVLAVHSFKFKDQLSDQEPRLTFSTFVALNWDKALVRALVIVVTISYTFGAFQKAPYWSFAFKVGVYGDTISAAWVGVDDYIREKTPLDASILPFTFKARPWYLAAKKTDQPLWATRTLATRTGRAMPVPEEFPGDFRNPESWRMIYRQKVVLKALEAALNGKDFAAASKLATDLIIDPDYVILPRSIMVDHEGQFKPYEKIATVKDYDILQRTADVSR